MAAGLTVSVSPRGRSIVSIVCLRVLRLRPLTKADQYVIPPLAEAHTLHFDNPGVFNVMNAMSLQ